MRDHEDPSEAVTVLEVEPEPEPLGELVVVPDSDGLPIAAVVETFWLVAVAIGMAGVVFACWLTTAADDTDVVIVDAELVTEGPLAAGTTADVESAGDVSFPLTSAPVDEPVIAPLVNPVGRL